MFRFTYSVTTKASPALAWRVFSNWHRWREFANIYGELHWREGRPWEPGSRLDIEVVHPVKVVLEHVITSCVPEKRVGWIDHGLGAAMAQWVTFDDRKPGATRVHTWGDLVHSGVMIGGRPIERIVSSFIETWYENFRKACDQLADSQFAEAGD